MAHESVLHHRLLWSLTEVQRWPCASVQTNKSLFPPRNPPLPFSVHSLRNPASQVRVHMQTSSGGTKMRWQRRRATQSTIEWWRKKEGWARSRKDKGREAIRKKERGQRIHKRGVWSLWTMAAWFKAPQKEPSSAMTDSADKRWSMKADRCADSRREALAPAGRVHYCGQTQLSGPNGPSASAMPPHWRHTAKSQGLSAPYLHSLQKSLTFRQGDIPKPVYCTTSFWVTYI